MLSDKIIEFCELEEQALDAFQVECLALRQQLIEQRFPNGYDAGDILRKDSDIKAIEHVVPMVYDVRTLFSRVVENGEPDLIEEKSALFHDLCEVSKKLQSAMNYMFFETKEVSPSLRNVFQTHGTYLHTHMMDMARINTLIGWNLVDEMLGKKTTLSPSSDAPAESHSLKPIPSFMKVIK